MFIMMVKISDIIEIMIMMVILIYTYIFKSWSNDYPSGFEFVQAWYLLPAVVIQMPKLYITIALR